MGKLHRYLAEALGTFMLVVVGSFAIVSAGLFPAAGAGIVAIALGFGLALLAGLYAFAAVSGGHYNPAVSLAMFLDGRLSVADMVRYWIAQFAGGGLIVETPLERHEDRVAVRVELGAALL